MTAAPLSIVVLISGSGSNLQALIDRSLQQQHYAVTAVISNQPDAYGLERARNAGIDPICINHTDYPDRESFEDALCKQIDQYKPDLLALAGFMRILTPSFVQHYQGRALNIHPSLLPAYRGLHTHRRVLEAGDAVHGCSVHFVTDELDGGPLIIQSRVPVLDGDTEEVLAARVLKDEHIIYPLVVNWYAQGRLRLQDHTVCFDGRSLLQPFVLQELDNAQNPLPS